jgi:hypothetical protein
VTCSPVPLIESLRVESIQLSHADREVAIRRLNENVVVIAYEAVSVTDPVVALIDPFKSIKKVFSIVIVLEDGFSLVTAAGNVINSALGILCGGGVPCRNCITTRQKYQNKRPDPAFPDPAFLQQSGISDRCGGTR